MIQHPLTDLSPLYQFSATPVSPGIDPNRLTLYSPVDQVHDALLYVINSAQRSIIVAMYGFDDEELANALQGKMRNQNVYVQLTLDSSQAAGAHEKQLLTQEAFPTTSVAVGRSEKGAIMHLKEMVIDSTILVTGSTNWSTGGESLQDNQLTIEINPAASALATTRITQIHTHMLQVKND
jgi:phosphatidylserine/phosphatidylglycerophosphate/cardiolipin synthase-like enzyme